MKNLLVIFLFLISIGTLQAKSNLNFKYFAQIPILSKGRIKPLDTYARANLLSIFEKSKLKEMPAIEWFAELLFDPNKAYNRRVFKIRNADVVKALNLTKNQKHNYTFVEVSTAINNETKLVTEISKIDRKERTPTQSQIYEMYFKVSKVFELSRSISLIIPQFRITSKEYAKKLKLPYNVPQTYLQVLKRKSLYTELVKDIFSEKEDDYTEEELELFSVGRNLEVIGSDTRTRDLRIIPPQFDITKETEWNSPWQTVQRGFGNPLTAKYFDYWSKLYTAYMNKDLDAFEEISGETLHFAKTLSKDLVSGTKLKWEVNYNKWDLFTNAVALYILAFLLLCISWLAWTKKLERASLTLLTIGSVLHLANLSLRCYIMTRPPVTTLYESIVFVSYISVLSAILIEFKQKNNLGTFIGTTLGTILLFLSFGYEKDGDSMGMLAAVLDTNFWLATHVVTITIGYGCAFVASLLGHVYLFQKIIKMKKKNSDHIDIKMTLKNMHGATLFALFFTVLGTILGGIWADQSWGRFWGWDPKENGAMLICMWLLWIVHGRLTKYFGPVEYAVTTSLTGIIVVLAWFGVNLLNVGLHSYGFTESIAMNIAIFTISELVICIGVYAYLKFSHQTKSLEA